MGSVASIRMPVNTSTRGEAGNFSVSFWRQISATSSLSKSMAASASCSRKAHPRTHWLVGSIAFEVYRYYPLHPSVRSQPLEVQNQS
jgi:hypothetical protein